MRSFEYPVIVKFTPAAHREIISHIRRSSGIDIRSNAISIAYYIANYIFSEDTLSYADILPACIHIIEDLPANDPNHTNPDRLFWFAAEVIDRVWRYASNNKITQKKCRDLIYNLFSPRVGGLWPIVHYDEFQFKNPVTDAIFRESLDSIMSLNDIASRNEQLAHYLSLYRQGYEYPLKSIEYRAFFESLKPLKTSKEKFEKILKSRAMQEYPDCLSRPDTIKEATLVLDELFRTDEGARIVGIHRLATFEQLLLHFGSSNVGVPILDYLIKHFDEFIDIIIKDCQSADLDPLDATITLYTAAATGCTEENELPLMKDLAKKITDLLKDSRFKSSTIDAKLITEAALRYARKHRRTILFQRSALQKFF